MCRCWYTCTCTCTYTCTCTCECTWFFVRASVCHSFAKIFNLARSCIAAYRLVMTSDCWFCRDAQNTKAILNRAFTTVKAAVKFKGIHRSRAFKLKCDNFQTPFQNPFIIKSTWNSVFPVCYERTRVYPIVACLVWFSSPAVSISAILSVAWL